MKKKNLKLLIIIILIITLCFSTTYAFLTLTSTKSNPTGEGGCFQVQYSANDINQTELQSTTNYKEGATTTITLSKDPDCTIYTEADIYLKTNTESTAPIDTNQALKYKIETSTGTEIASGTVDTTSKTEDMGQKLTLTNQAISLTTTETTYNVYLWIDPDISAGVFNDTTYSGKIYATSIQTSDVNQ